jgi:hypothetical protein
MVVGVKLRYSRMRRENGRFVDPKFCNKPRVTQSRQKSYVDHRRRELSFGVGDFVYHKVSPMRRLRNFKVRGKLAPRFIGPFKILEKSGEVA